MTDPREPIRVLYIYPDTMGPSVIKERNALFHLSGLVSGNLLAILIPQRSELQGIIATTAEKIGDFRLVAVKCESGPRTLQKVCESFKLLRLGSILIRENRAQVLVAHGVYRTGITGALLSLLWRIPLVVEIPGHPTKGIRLDRSFIGRQKFRIAPHIVQLVTKIASRVRLLYPAQLEGVIPGSKLTSIAAKTRVFHEFVPVSMIAPNWAARNREILFVGFPWFLKGVDLLIDAFLNLCDEFPEHTLRVVGYCPDMDEWRSRARNHPRIQLCGPMPNERITEMMASAEVFVLPSRTEAMGRVLLEAMAAGTPVIASRTDGIPYYVEHETTGLLFETENARDLELQLRRMLADEGLRRELAEKAHEKVRTAYSEQEYAKRFYAMLSEVVET